MSRMSTTAMSAGYVACERFADEQTQIGAPKWGKEGPSSDTQPDRDSPWVTQALQRPGGQSFGARS